MKKTLSILAIAVMTFGMFSCEAETDVQETENLMAELEDQDSTDSGSSQADDR
ncbi:hypothetical protein [Flagellimonas sp. CMM7]|uniref:hypothetical protein n=1 Tax=Flagellimonas sp. CMM7 TaxID=2654676 RepID=UPI0013CF74A4|nr:hypothetical protein [Flagellimonas sp. CMM7]UII79286.1 hypothetical protein LV704_16695 [Flagellimonas sp. CMM7]